MLASKAHVKIGNYEFLLDEGQEGHYRNHIQSVLVGKTDITGQPGKQQIRPEKLLWAFDDWSGGEGNRKYYAEDPTVYDYSDGLNPRIRGQLTGRPSRSSVSITPTDVTQRPYMTAANGSLWIGGSDGIYESTDSGASWTSRTAGLSGYVVTALAGGQDYLYYSAWKSASSGTRALKYIAAGGAGANLLTAGDVTSAKSFMGMAVLHGKLFGWTGRQLWEFDVSNSFTLASDKYRKVFDVGNDLSPDNGGTTWWADIVAGDNNLIFFRSIAGVSNVYEYRQGVARPIWTAPYGFTIKSIRVMLGIVWAAGHFGGSADGAGRGCLYAVPLDSYRPTFIGWFRKQQNLSLQMQEMATSYGAQLLVCGAWTGRIFVYDAEQDGITMLDDIGPDDSFSNNNDKIGCVYTYGLNRLAVRYTPNNGAARTQWKVYLWQDDEPGNREAATSQTLTSGEWDIGFPQEIKTLQGFHVTFKPMVANQSIQVEYSVDGNSFVSAGTITSATTGNATGRCFITASAAPDFFRMKYRVTLAGTSSTIPPILYSLTAESFLKSYLRQWQLIIRLKDEQGPNRPAFRSQSAEEVRDWLETTMLNRAQVTFQDGFRYRDPGTYNSYTVTIDEFDDAVLYNAQGDCRVVLREITK